MMKLLDLGKGSIGSSLRFMAAVTVAIYFCQRAERALASNQSSFGVYRFFSQGSGRVMAMGGAYAATADDATAIDYNPAGAAISRWRFDFGGTNNRIDDQAGPSMSNSYGSYQTTSESYSFIQYAAAARVGRVVFGLGVSTPYAYSFSSTSQNATVVMTNYSAMVAWRVGETLGVGVSGHLESLKEHSERFGTAAEDGTGSATSWTAGALYRTRVVGLGLVYFQGHEIPLRRDQGQDVSVAAWLRDAQLPSATCFGGFMRLSENFLVAVDLDRYEVPNGLVDAASGVQYSSDLALTPGMQQILHGGFEWTLLSDSHMNLIFRAGGYVEPARISGGESRLHRTYGLQAQFGPAVLTVSFDQANQFTSTSQGFSLVLGAI